MPLSSTVNMPSLMSPVTGGIGFWPIIAQQLQPTPGRRSGGYDPGICSYSKWRLERFALGVHVWLVMASCCHRHFSKHLILDSAQCLWRRTWIKIWRRDDALCLMWLRCSRAFLVPGCPREFHYEVRLHDIFPLEKDCKSPNRFAPLMPGHFNLPLAINKWSCKTNWEKTSLVRMCIDV